MPAFSAGDLADGVAEVLGMVERHRRDHGGERAIDDIGGVKPAAEPDFEQQHVGRMAREQTATRRRGDLEHGDRRTGIGAFAFGQRIGELRRPTTSAPLARRGRAESAR